MEQLSYPVQSDFTRPATRATACTAHAVARLAMLQFDGIVRYFSSLRRAQHSAARTLLVVQLPYLGLIESL